MNILIVCENYVPHYGGAEVLFMNLAERLAARGHSVRLITRMLDGTPRSEIRNGVHIFRVRAPNRYLFTFFASPLVIKHARWADVIQTTTFNGAPPAWLGAKLTGTPVVLTVLEVWVGQWRALTEMGPLRAFFHDILERCVFALPFDRYVCISDATKRALIRYKGRSDGVERVYCGFDHDEWAKKKRRTKKLWGKNVFFSWGRPGISKGHDDIIRALPAVLKEIPDARVVLMLSNKETYAARHAVLHELIEREGVQDSVQIIDPVGNDRLAQYIQSTDVVVLPSLSEGFGYAVLEACELGMPVVATDNASIPEVIWGKFCLVPPSSPRRLAEGMIDALKGKYTRSSRKVFSWDVMIDAYEGVYRVLMRER